MKTTTFVYQFVTTGIIVVLGQLVSESASAKQETMAAVRIETIEPERIEHLHANVKKVRRQGGNPRSQGDLLTFDGTNDGNRQVDPQIAVGRAHVLHGTNQGFTIYDKEGKFVDGVSQRGFKNGIDPKVFYSRQHDVFGFDLWVYWDEQKTKPVNISISETGDPTGAWNTYSVHAPEGVDGGAIGFSQQWVGYSFPGGLEQTFVMSMDDCVKGKATKVFHFAGNLGHPINTQDQRDGLLFFTVTGRKFIIREVVADEQGNPVVKLVSERPHSLKTFGSPPASPQKNTDKKVASGDRRPKAIVLQNESLWFSHAVNNNGRSAVQWHQVKLDGTVVQSGLIADEKRSFIQTTLAVNKQEDVLVGFQETGPDMFVSPRIAIRHSDDPPGTLRESISLGEGLAATEGGAWGDYSGAAVDGENGLDLWTVQSIADATGRGDTVIARQRFEKRTKTEGAER
ncbi:MAG: hypothetical protein AAFN77_01790 [Planctomycetota bacterium]